MAVKKNVIANFAGSAWSAIVGLAFVPIYIHYLGVEAYGVIGVFVSLQAVLGILDMGLATTLTREMARLSATDGSSEQLQDTLRTLEWLYWGSALGVGLLLAAISPLIANHWVRPDKLPVAEIQHAFLILSLVTALRWPCSLYIGGLNGLQRQISLNLINAAAITVQGVGGVLVLWLVSPTLETYLTWQIVAALFQVAMLLGYTRNVLPKIGRRPKFDRAILRQIWRFAAGMSSLSVLVLILTQLDKVVLSRLLDLKMFGYYAFAIAVSSSLTRLITPLYSAVFPRLTQLVAEKKLEELSRFYHQASQLGAALIVPASLMLIFFSREIIFAWTGDRALVEETYLVISLLSAGTLINALLSVPYALQLAYGWTGLALRMNLISVVIIVPMLIFLIVQYGIVGPPIAWILLNGGYLYLDIKLMHQRLIVNEKWEWYIKDVGVPLFVGLAVAAVFRFLLDVDVSRTLLWIILIGIGIAISFGTFLGSSRLRSFMFVPARIKSRLGVK